MIDQQKFKLSEICDMQNVASVLLEKLYAILG